MAALAHVNVSSHMLFYSWKGPLPVAYILVWGFTIVAIFSVLQEIFSVSDSPPLRETLTGLKNN